MGSAELRPFRASTFQHTTSKAERGGGSAAHHQGGFVSLGVASAAPRFDGPKGVEASALGRETRNTQDNNHYHRRAFEFNSTCIHATRATLHSAQGSSRCRRVEGPLAEPL